MTTYLSNISRDNPWSGIPPHDDSRISDLEKFLLDSGYNVPTGLTIGLIASDIVSKYDEAKKGTEIYNINCEMITPENFDTEVLSKMYGIRRFKAVGETIGDDLYPSIKRILDRKSSL